MWFSTWKSQLRLDYLKELGVNGIYFCPITEGATNHRYDTIDYIEPVNCQKRDYIRKYVEEHKKNYLLNLSPYTKKFNSNYWKSKFYNAYKCSELEKFYLSNKDKLKKILFFVII